MKPKEIQKIFSEAAHSYETVNHVLTMGLDMSWRKKAAKHAVQGGGTRWLDVCSGTGNMAALLSKLGEEKTAIVSQDFCLAMMNKARLKPEAEKISFCISNACKLPFPDNTFDLVTISFATRNINENQDVLVQYFREFYRILRPGGRFVNLETSQPQSKIIRKVFHFYIRLIVAPIGCLISGSKTAYKYLSYSIPLFYSAEELSNILYKAGFKTVSFSRLTFGACAVHTSVK